MRVFLDRVATVDDPIKRLEEYNMSMDFVTTDASFYYFMADAGGNYAILEYVDPTEGIPVIPIRWRRSAAAEIWNVFCETEPNRLLLVLEDGDGNCSFVLFIVNR